MADFTFDGVNKIIKEPVGSGNTTFDVGRDIYSAWKRWVQGGSAQFDAAFIVEGGTPIGATGLFTGTTFLLTNGWKIMAADHDHQLTLTGNLFSDDGVVATPNPTGQSTISVSSSVNAQGVATGGVQQATLEAIQLLVTELHNIRGLDASDPAVFTPDSISTALITLDMTGDGENIKTVTRQ